jgi:hypothetical protein
MSVGVMPVGRRRTAAETAPPVRCLRCRSTLVAASRMGMRSVASAAMLRRRRSGVAMTWRAAIFLRQCNSDQFFDVAEIRYFLAGAK